MSETDYQAVSDVLSSKYREIAMLEIADGPMMPSEIADAHDVDIAHVSRALTKMQDMGLTELLVDEDTKKGRLYGLTSEGQEVATIVADRKA